MILEDINDYYKHRLLIPRTSTSDSLDKAIVKYKSMIRLRKAKTSKNEYEIESAYKNVVFHMQRLKQELIDRGLWG